MTKQELLSQIETEFKNAFPHSWIRFNKGCLDNSTIFVTFGIQSKEHWANDIEMNDPGHHSIGLYGFNEENENIIDVEKNTGGALTVRSKSPYLAFDSVKFGWRDARKQTPEKVINKFKKYFVKMNKVINENIDNLPLSCKLK